MIKIDCDLEIFSAVRDGFHGSVTKTHVMDAVTFGVIQRLRFFYGERLSEGRRVLRRRRSPGGIWILIGIGFLSKKTHTRRTVLESSGVTVSRFSVRAGSLRPRKSRFLRKVPVRVCHFLPSGL